MIRNGQFALASGVLYKLLFAGIALLGSSAVAIVWQGHASAFTNQSISPVSGSIINVASNAPDGTIHHVLKHENSSSMTRVSMVAYYDRTSVNAGQVITIRDRNADPQRCHTYPDGNTIAGLIRVTLSIRLSTGVTQSEVYLLRGDHVCVGAGGRINTRANNNPVANRFFTTYQVPAGFTLAQMGAPDPETNLYKVNINIEYAPGVQMGTTGGNDSLKQQVTFRVGISNPPCGVGTQSTSTCARYLGVSPITASDGTNRNFSTLGRPIAGNGNNLYTRQYFKFGLPCSQAQAVPMTVTVYDVDNGNVNWRRAHIRVERSTDGWATFAPLSTVGGGPEQLQVTGPGYSVTNGGTRIWPADGDRRAMNVRFILQPGVNYRVVADSIHYRNLFGVGLPTETIFGDIDCRYNLQPNITVGASVAMPGGALTGISGGILNSGSTTSYGSAATAVVRYILPRGVGTLNIPGAGTASTANSNGFGCRLADAVADGIINCRDIFTDATGRQYPQNNTSIFNGADPLADATLEPGDRVCYMTVVNLYEQTAADTDWRHSNSECVTVAKMPSVQVWGNDLRVGGRYITDVTNTNDALIQTGLTRIGQYFGSWTEYGVLAPGTVSGMASGSGLANGNASNLESQWSRLTFANNSTDTRCLATGSGCFTDDGTRMGVLPDVNQAVDNGLFAGVPVNNNGGTIGATTVNSSSVERRLNDTIDITDNIQLAAGPYANERDIPQLIIIADRINIHSNVTRIDAWLIATGANATINTCSDGPAYPAALTVSDCDQPLVINGPTIAKTLLMRRTAGASSAATADEPAEKFNLRSEAYIWSYNQAQRNGNLRTTYTRELAPRY